MSSHFRVLVIGRANAGKTTLLKRVCDSTENPQIFDPAGSKIDASIVEGSNDRGEHDIENQLIFKSNPQYIFHDSRGFESGSVEEMQKVNDFIAERAASNPAAKQLHMIWYCLPTDTDRPLLEADKQFFDHFVSVPVVAIFTKFDALETKAFTELKQAGLNRQEAKLMRTEKALEMLTANFMQPLSSTRFNPTDHVHLGNMDKADSSCKKLIEMTAEAIDDDMHRRLFVSAQQQDKADLSIFYAVQRALIYMSVPVREVVEGSLGYFPHSWEAAAFQTYDAKPEMFNTNVTAFVTALQTKYPHIRESMWTPSGYAETLAAICICAEQTFTQSAAAPKALGPACRIALDAYAGSDLERDVKYKISRIPTQHFRELEQKGRRTITKAAPELVEIIKTHRLRIKM